MSAQILDGKALAAEIRSEVKTQVAALAEKGVSTALAVILRGLPPFLLLLCAAVMLVGTAIAVVSAVLSHLIQKAADLKADQDLTI